MGTSGSVDDRHRVAFTLVELLVGLSIIAVLLGLLAPALAAAREAGRRTVCRANMHTFGLAFEMYRNDHHPEPFPYAAESFNALAGWLEPLRSLEPYLGVVPPRFDDRRRRVVGVSDALVCPTDPGAWLLVGWSYYYYPTEMMQFPEDLLKRVAPMYREGSSSNGLPVLLDAQPWHGGGRFSSGAYNALWFDGSVGEWP